MANTFIIAEAGVNHNGNLEMAKRLIDVAADAGADAVKFQTFTANKLVSRFAQKAEYQKKHTDQNESQLAMIQKLELSREAHEVLFSHARSRSIQFLSTPFDFAAIDLLYGMGLPIFKIPSGEITNLPHLRKVGSLGRDIILSTGMASLSEIEDAVQVLIKAGTPLERITVLHCNTEYPTPMHDVNLRAMHTIRDHLKVKVGYSDHTLGIEVPIAAVALGATLIEKHFTIDRKLPGPDHAASLEPSELKSMVQAIRHIEQALGSATKAPTPSEIKNIPIARKSVVAARNIKKGEILSPENLVAKRPGTGISPMKWDLLVGRPSPRDYQEDELIDSQALDIGEEYENRS